jgi:hypothetical protein
MTRRALLVFAAITCRSGLIAQSVPTFSNGINTVVRSAEAAKPTTASFDPSTIEMVKNRARTFGDQVSGAGKRYWALTDADIQGKTAEQIQRLLTPSEVKPGDGVRVMDIVVELLGPIKILSSPDKPVYIGTAQVDARAARKIEVNSNIVVNGITIVTVGKSK